MSYKANSDKIQNIVKLAAKGLSEKAIIAELDLPVKFVRTVLKSKFFRSVLKRWPKDDDEEAGTHEEK